MRKETPGITCQAFTLGAPSGSSAMFSNRTAGTSQGNTT